MIITSLKYALVSPNDSRTAAKLIENYNSEPTENNLRELKLFVLDNLVSIAEYENRESTNKDFIIQTTYYFIPIWCTENENIQQLAHEYNIKKDYETFLKLQRISKMLEQVTVREVVKKNTIETRVLCKDNGLTMTYYYQSSTDNGNTWKTLEERENSLIELLGYVNHSILFNDFKGFYLERVGKEIKLIESK